MQLQIKISATPEQAKGKPRNGTNLKTESFRKLLHHAVDLLSLSRQPEAAQVVPDGVVEAHALEVHHVHILVQHLLSTSRPRKPRNIFSSPENDLHTPGGVFCEHLRRSSRSPVSTYCHNSTTSTGTATEAQTRPNIKSTLSCQPPHQNLRPARSTSPHESEREYGRIESN